MSDTAPRPLLYLPLDRLEGGAADQSGNGRTGTPQGNAPAIEDDVFGHCLSVADGGHVSVAEGADRALHLGAVLTVEAWALVSERRPGHCRIVGKGEGNGRNYVLWLIDGTGWMFQWNQFSGGFVVTRPTIRLNTWYHLAAVVRDGTSTLYVHGRDGRLIATATGKHSGTTGNTTEALTIGTGFAGRIAHVRVYAQALRQEDIERDIAGDLTAGRAARVASLLSLAQPQAAFRFGVSGTTIAAAESMLPLMRPRLGGGFTLEAIVKPAAVESPGLFPQGVIASCGGANGWELALRGYVPVFRIAVSEPSAEGGARRRADRVVAADQTARSEAVPNVWHHIALTISPGRDAKPAEYALYLDGALSGFVVGTQDDVSAGSDVHPLAVGARPAAATDDRAPFSGEICEIRFWDRALDPQEIRLNGARRLSGEEFGLRHYWPIDEGRGAAFGDRTDARAELRATGAESGWIAANDTGTASGARLRLIDAATVIYAAAEVASLRTEVAHWAAEKAAVDARTTDLQQSIVAIREHHRHAVEEADAAERSAEAKIRALRDSLAALARKQREDRQTLQDRLADGRWGLGEIIQAVDEQLRQARETARSDDAYRLDRLSLDLKALPLDAGRTLRFPDRAERAALPPGTLSSVHIDLESRERFEASQRRSAEVPDVLDLTASMARRRLAAAGFLMTVAHSVVPDDPRWPGRADRLVGTVRDQNPRSGQTLTLNERVTVYIGLPARPS